MTRPENPTPRLTLLVASLVLLLPLAAHGTLVHSGDSTIQGGLCVGFDCSANEPMGFATIKIEENNLRIAAADSSTVSGFPTRDWQIEFNSSSSGGGSYFMVRDCGNSGAAGSVDSTCGGTPMLTIEGGADNESIHVDSAGNQGGNVGFGTATPVVDLHVLSGNTPTLRLEQDNSSGFTPQSWDVAGNESNFFIRDVTNGSALPLRIEPGTASNTLYLDNLERIGSGTTAPQAALDVRQGGSPGPLSGFTPALLLVNSASSSDAAFLTLIAGNASNSQFAFGDTDDAFAGQIVYQHSGNYYQFLIGGTEYMRLSTSGLTTTTAGGACNPGPCDGIFAPGYQVEPIAENAAYMWRNRHLRGVGPTPEDEPINLTTKTAGIIHELEKAHIYIEQLHQRLEGLTRELAELRAEVAAER